MPRSLPDRPDLAQLRRQARELQRDAAIGATIEATLALTDARGGPVCAAVRPPQVEWRLAPPR